MLARLGIQLALGVQRATSALEEEVGAFTAGEFCFRSNITCHDFSLSFNAPDGVHFPIRRKSGLRATEQWSSEQNPPVTAGYLRVLPIQQIRYDDAWVDGSRYAEPGSHPESG